MKRSSCGTGCSRPRANCQSVEDPAWYPPAWLVVSIDPIRLTLMRFGPSLDVLVVVYESSAHASVRLVTPRARADSEFKVAILQGRGPWIRVECYCKRITPPVR